MITVPNKYDSNAWPSAVRRIAPDVTLVSEIAKLIPTVNATYMKSRYRGGSAWLKSMPPSTPV
ncbi:hypothetical protein D3C74_431680 [compost metagenome]